MKRENMLRAAWLALIVLAVVVISTAGHGASSGDKLALTRPSTAGATIPIVRLPDGQQGIADAGGSIVPLRNYRRIASGSALSDELLLALAEPERIVALAQYGREHSATPQLYGSRIGLRGPADLEVLRDQHIDLLVLNHYGAAAELARARETGCEVYNLGDMRGLTTLDANIAAIALLLGDSKRGSQLAADFKRRLGAVAADIPLGQRKRAIYVSAYGGQLLGGTLHTSYHDVLTAAGLIDAAAEHYVDWPKYDPEELLKLDPEIIVTTTGSAEQLCHVSGLDRLRACRTPSVLAFEDALLSNAGLGMLNAAEQLRERVYGAPTAR